MSVYDPRDVEAIEKAFSGISIKEQVYEMAMRRVKAEAVAMIREEGDERLKGLDDTDLESLWREWSTVSACASFLMPTPTGVEAFVAWATTAPYQRYHKENKALACSRCGKVLNKAGECICCD
jgi:hypothetical protein